jgi:hypothetical protein
MTTSDSDEKHPPKLFDHVRNTIPAETLFHPNQLTWIKHYTLFQAASERYGWG